MSRRFPGFLRHREKKGAVRWRGNLQPRVTSPAYQIDVWYKLGQIPKVKVVWPSLAANAPHLYSDGSLCLYWPKEWTWQDHYIIAETIVPWTALWLYYYELWQDVGEWLGPSSHDKPSSQE